MNAMSTVLSQTLLHNYCRGKFICLPKTSNLLLKPYSLNYPFNSHPNATTFCRFKNLPTVKVSGNSVTETSTVKTFESNDVVFQETFPLKQTQREEGKVFIRLDKGKEKKRWELSVGCDLAGKWILHWGVTYIGDTGCEWDQPPNDMIPPGSISIKDYAIETPLKKLSEGDAFHQVTIDIDPKSEIAAINFVLKDEETGTWYQHKGRDFKVPFVDYLQDDDNAIGRKTVFDLWPGALGQISNKLDKAEASQSKDQDSKTEFKEPKRENMRLEGFYEELAIVKEVVTHNTVIVSVRKCLETAKNLLYLETDLPGDVVIHWGVCRDDTKKWEIPAASHPPETIVFKNKALRTLLKPREGGNGCCELFTLEKEFTGFVFVLKLNENTWLKCMGNDFYIPLPSSSSSTDQHSQVESSDASVPAKTEEADQKVSYTDGIISEIRSLMSDISCERGRKSKTKAVQESILQEIEKLAAEAYSIFRSSTPTFAEEAVVEPEISVPSPKVSPGTGTGFEILCQGFNWESHKSGRWYMELKEKAAHLSSLGFTVIWLPPPTESVSPEGYMPTDLYNLNSRYGTVDELKDVVNKFHKVGIKVLGDAVLNHRCAQFQNANGVWNVFGGRLNWDDRAVVGDDPHFQGRGNKSSGDNFHAAPNIDHSQDFVRKDIKEWLCWLRREIGYDGWRLDFVRGFWGGYVKDYLDASEPHFSVGEYWDSLSYTYGEMDHNQDAHRQRIIDWINATNGFSGAFDVTTKGILHSALERCEYWRLSDQKGKPPGVVGWWPSRAVTFIENHDTGSTQGHWRFPRGKEMQGYAYILTHPGTPSVFYDHIFSDYRSEIETLLSLRKRKKLHCRSIVEIVKAERDVYAAIIDEKVAMKIGPGHYEPPNGPQKWSFVMEGRDYKIWEAS
ncbi:alpha-amylase 3, chloroplastic isoform X1 [Pistacia vera]|uniref:alpha-amylase 3, chloroplastic isoform X1 n=1 Tax=Pistacia vera TaxID=55513 RepID=UPI00126316C9|nr:alpha-amylase 3, chloroplastic isoform X1 [Pistacia vera]